MQSHALRSPDLSALAISCVQPPNINSPNISLTVPTRRHETCLTLGLIILRNFKDDVRIYKVYAIVYVQCIWLTETLEMEGIVLCQYNELCSTKQICIFIHPKTWLSKKQLCIHIFGVAKILISLFEFAILGKRSWQMYQKLVSVWSCRYLYLILFNC